MGYLQKSFLSLACLDRFRRKPVSERNSRSLLVRCRRSCSTGSMRSCSRATWLSTDAHCRDEQETGDSKSAPSVCRRPKRQAGAAAHPLVSGRDVLQSSGRRLAGRGVDVALVQHAVVQTDHLGVPQPLHPPGHPGHLAEGGEVLGLALSARHSYSDSMRLTTVRKTGKPLIRLSEFVQICASCCSQ